MEKNFITFLWKMGLCHICGEQFHQGKCSSPSQNFVTFPQQSFSNKVTLIVALNICLMLLINHFKMLNDNNSF